MINAIVSVTDIGCTVSTPDETISFTFKEMINNKKYDNVLDELSTMQGDYFITLFDEQVTLGWRRVESNVISWYKPVKTRFIRYGINTNTLDYIVLANYLQKHCSPYKKLDD